MESEYNVVEIGDFDEISFEPQSEVHIEEDKEVVKLNYNESALIFIQNKVCKDRKKYVIVTKFLPNGKYNSVTDIKMSKLFSFELQGRYGAYLTSNGKIYFGLTNFNSAKENVLETHKRFELYLDKQDEAKFETIFDEFSSFKWDDISKNTETRKLMISLLKRMPNSFLVYYDFAKIKVFGKNDITD